MCAISCWSRWWNRGPHRTPAAPLSIRGIRQRRGGVGPAGRMSPAGARDHGTAARTAPTALGRPSTRACSGDTGPERNWGPRKASPGGSPAPDERPVQLAIPHVRLAPRCLVCSLQFGSEGQHGFSTLGGQPRRRQDPVVLHDRPQPSLRRPDERGERPEDRTDGGRSPPDVAPDGIPPSHVWSPMSPSGLRDGGTASSRAPAPATALPSPVPQK